jgi:hypothetical protein
LNAQPSSGSRRLALGHFPLPEHRIARLESIPGAHLPGEAATLRKDLEKLLTP